MKRLVGVSALMMTAFLASTWADSTMADQWRCVMEKKVGAKLERDLKPMEFYLNDEEFRILDRPSIMKQYGVDPREGIWDDDKTATYYVRKASQDPRKQAWFPLEHSRSAKEGGPPRTMWTSDNIIGPMKVHIESGRFQVIKAGSYVWDGPDEGADPWFGFGTCRPYYD